MPRAVHRSPYFACAPMRHAPPGCALGRMAAISDCRCDSVQACQTVMSMPRDLALSASQCVVPSIEFYVPLEVALALVSSWHSAGNSAEKFPRHGLRRTNVPNEVVRPVLTCWLCVSTPRFTNGHQTRPHLDLWL